MTTLNKILSWIGAAAIFIVAIFYEEQKIKDRNAEIEDLKVKEQDASAKQKISDIDSNIAKEQQKIVDAQQPISNDELVKELNNNLKS